jgi:hypothetical protein
MHRTTLAPITAAHRTPTPDPLQLDSFPIVVNRITRRADAQRINGYSLDFMKRNLVLLAFVLASMVGCSSTAKIKRDGQPTGSPIRMNVSAGKFEYRKTTYPITDSSHQIDVQLTVSELHLDSEWNPTSSFCLYESRRKTGAYVCLQFTYSRREGLIQARHFYQSAEKDPPSEKTLEPKYKVNDPIAITMNDTGGRMNFFVNGKLMFSTTEAFPPVKFEYSCSSAVCNFAFPK